jgi:hypothetical protein
MFSPRSIEPSLWFITDVQTTAGLRHPPNETRFCCGQRAAVSSTRRLVSARNSIEDLAGHAPLDCLQVGLCHQRGRHAGAGIHLHRHQRLANPTRSDRIDAQATGEIQCRRTHKAFETCVDQADGRAPGFCFRQPAPRSRRA